MLRLPGLVGAGRPSRIRECRVPSRALINRYTTETVAETEENVHLSMQNSIFIFPPFKLFNFSPRFF
jgi:hypothetical protein